MLAHKFDMLQKDVGCQNALVVNPSMSLEIFTIVGMPLIARMNRFVFGRNWSLS